ncbi:hypothetical protein evm_002682 [Chilo suppressalis]|nr:hypothetical protein evm_002682 [Chilo suppressalis]
MAQSPYSMHREGLCPSSGDINRLMMMMIPKISLVLLPRVVEPINRLLDTVPFDAVFYSLDWHPPDHVSFIDNVHMRELHPSSPVSADKAQAYDTVVFAGPPPMKQRLWPRHCVQDTWGADLHKDLKKEFHADQAADGTRYPGKCTDHYATVALMEVLNSF